MLSFARKSESRFAKHNIADLLNKTISLTVNDNDLKIKYDFRQIKIERHFQKDISDIYCDGTKIQQVFLNILKKWCLCYG